MSSSMTLDTTNNRYVFKSDSSASESGYAVTFATEGKFVDKNIRVEIHKGDIGPYFTPGNFGTYFNTGDQNNYSISIIPKASSTSGFVNTTNSSNDATGTTGYYTIKTAVPATDAADVNIYTTDGSNAGTNIGNISGVIGSKATSEPNSGYYIAFKGEGNSKITTAGWIEQGSLNKTTSAQKYFPIATAAASITGTNTVTASNIAWATPSNNVTLSDTNNGIAITATGGGTASVTATANITTPGFANGNNFASATLNANEATKSSTKYISAVIIPSSKSLTITNNGTANVTSSGTTNVTSNSTSAGTITIAAKKSATDQANTTENVVVNGKWKINTLEAAGVYYYGATIANQAEFSTVGGETTCTTPGYVETGSLSGGGSVSNGTISTSASDPGNSYTENTEAIVPAGGWLTLTAGYYSATKISLDTLVPNGSNITNVSGASSSMLAGVTAYDNTGALITGNIQTYNYQASGAYTVD